MPLPLCRLAVARLAAARRAAMAVEFAIVSLALFIFLFGIINLGDLGLVLGALQRGVQGAARQAAVTAAANLANNAACPTAAQIQGYFGSYAAPVINTAAATPSYGAGSPWVINDATLPGSYLVMTETYTWKPLGFAAFGTGFPVSLTAAAFVMGSSGTVHC